MATDETIKMALVLQKTGQMKNFGELQTRMTWETINNTALYQEAMREAAEINIGIELFAKTHKKI
jgi:hypothetical protein